MAGIGKTALADEFQRQQYGRTLFNSGNFMRKEPGVNDLCERGPEPGPLDPDEWKIMQGHAQIGAELQPAVEEARVAAARLGRTTD